MKRGRKVPALQRFVVILVPAHGGWNPACAISSYTDVMDRAANWTQSAKRLDLPGFMGANSMPAIATDLIRAVPSIVPSDIPAMSDDECLLRLARAIEEHDTEHLDEVARLIARLAVHDRIGGFPAPRRRLGDGPPACCVLPTPVPKMTRFQLSVSLRPRRMLSGS